MLKTTHGNNADTPGKRPDSNSHHREYQKSEDINREHHFAIDPACSSCLLPFLPHPPEVIPEIKPLLILLPFHHAQCINPRWNISATFATIRAIAIRTILASFLRDVSSSRNVHGALHAVRLYSVACRINREESREESLWPNQSSSRKGAISAETQAV